MSDPLRALEGSGEASGVEHLWNRLERSLLLAVPCVVLFLRLVDLFFLFKVAAVLWSMWIVLLIDWLLNRRWR